MWDTPQFFTELCNMGIWHPEMIAKSLLTLKNGAKVNIKSPQIVFYKWGLSLVGVNQYPMPHVLRICSRFKII